MKDAAKPLNLTRALLAPSGADAAASPASDGTPGRSNDDAIGVLGVLGCICGAAGGSNGCLSSLKGVPPSGAVVPGSSAAAALTAVADLCRASALNLLALNSGNVPLVGRVTKEARAAATLLVDCVTETLRFHVCLHSSCKACKRPARWGLKQWQLSEKLPLCE